MKERYIPTGNEFISLPCIREEDGAILDFTFLHMGYKGLIDVRGTEETPLFLPFINIYGMDKLMQGLKWRKSNDWIPTFSGYVDQLKVYGTIVAPIGERGFVYQLRIVNESKDTIEFAEGLKGVWGDTYHSINEDKKLEAPKFCYQSGWNHSYIFDMRLGTSIFAFAPMFNCDVKSSCEQREGGNIYYRFEKGISLAEGEEYIFESYWGLGFEEVAAATSAKEMLRHGFDWELQQTDQWLASRRKSFKEEAMNPIFNTNLFFNFFYASGRTIDTEELVLVTSRSPRYYVSAAYWDRDSLLWSFPSILLADAAYAKEMLMYIFTRQIRNIGVHSRYIDGTLLEPGFELDELCAPIIALYNYVKTTHDYNLLKLDAVQSGVNHILKILDSKKHNKIALYETFLQPTDDMHVYPYITYDNVLVWKLLHNLSELYHDIWDEDRIHQLVAKADEVEKAIDMHCVKEYEGKKIFAWSVDTDGKWDIYDEPPGSLQLLPHYGFCDVQEEIYVNTVNIIRRPEYPFSFHDCYIADIGCPHAPHPWVLSIANSLLCGRVEHGKTMLLRAQMDNGIACESVDENTGESTTGDAFATCAGFLAYAINEAFSDYK